MNCCNIPVIYPELFDFSQKDKLDFYVYSAYPDNVKGLSFNGNGDELNCKVNGKMNVKCSISKNHFSGKKNGYYFIRHKNNLNISTISYEAPPVKVILNKENKEILLNILLFVCY